MKNIMLSNNLEWVIIYNSQDSLPTELLLVILCMYHVHCFCLTMCGCCNGQPVAASLAQLPSHRYVT